MNITTNSSNVKHEMSEKIKPDIIGQLYNTRYKGLSKASILA